MGNSFSTSVLQTTCLKSTSSLRTQLLLSFGVSAFVSLAVVVILACTSAYLAGATVKDRADQLMRGQVTDNLLLSSQLVAEKLNAYMMDFEGTAQLMAEAIQDRIVGYPYEGWEDDRYVPFFDMDANDTRVYPLKMAPPRLDWDIDVNLNADVAVEHLQEREKWFKMFPQISTASAMYFMQGSCDPSQQDASGEKPQVYYPNCTSANNDVTTGGVVQPTATNKGLYEKAGDISVFLKALFEAQYEAMVLGVYFVNSGAGSNLLYPGHYLDGSAPPYKSIGCDWMNSTNPYTGKPLASDEEIARCHPAGTLVPLREYNVLERAWCRDFALNPGKVRWYGPFRANDSGLPIMTIGRSVFDRLSGELIACIGIDVAISDLTVQLNGHTMDQYSQLALVGFETGELVGMLNDTISDESVFLDPAFYHDHTHTFREAIDFEEKWTRSQIDEVYTNTILTKNDSMLTSYPLPLPPEEYDPEYRPRFLVYHEVSKHVFDVVDEIDTSIDGDVRRICILSVGLGALGMILVLSIVWCVSRMLTQPLLWMEGIAWRIVNHTDARSGEDLEVATEDEEQKAATLRCAPKTEVNELVAEFRKMIQGFSGSGASHVADSPPHEIRNDLTWHSDFQQLYSRKKKSFRCATSESVSSGSTEGESTSGHRSAAVYPELLPSPPTTMNSTKISGPDDGPLIVPAPVKRNRAHVVTSFEDGNLKKSGIQEEPIRLHRSQLFWWIVVLIVIPLLLTNTVICAIVSHDIVTMIPSWVAKADAASHDLEESELHMISTSKASLLAALVFEAVRDLHLLTRITGWVFFGGVPRSGSFSKMDSAVNECKTFTADTCPFYSSSRVPCPCEWEDVNNKPCGKFNEGNNRTSARDAQYMNFVVQSLDADPITGRRMASPSYPSLGNNSSTTYWWSNVTEIPGSAKGVEASGFATTYDRLRVSSSASTAFFPVYNYGTSLGRPKATTGIYKGFEEDGLFTGFTGCGHEHGKSSYWSSTEDNYAAMIAPELCPIGKHGYDPRCRGWYSTGKSLYESNRSPVHITAPYEFASVPGRFAASATSPIANPKSGEYIGQVLLDFFPSDLRSTLEGLDVPEAFLITPEEDATGGDTVVAPDQTENLVSSSIVDLLFLYDRKDSDYRKRFETEVLAPMKRGEKGAKEFTRTKADGSAETLLLSYAPVYERVLLPLSPDDFSRGVEVSQVLLYSVGVAKNVDEMHVPFHEIEDDVNAELGNLRLVYVLVTIIMSLLFTAFSCIITFYVTTPMITLLRAVRNINSGDVDNEFPPLNGGSREVHRVYNTFAKLYKVVRVSNTAFFSGNLKWAYHFVQDALQLFRKVHDEKAVAIACNNLGNTLFAMTYDSKEETFMEASTEESSLVSVALRHYDEAVAFGQREFDDTPVSELKADFALQLSDRLFNRGLFLLLVDGEPTAPPDARERAFEDIARARLLDYDVKDYMLEHRLLLKNSADYFCRLIRRINGLADFFDDTGLQEVWDVKELIDDADQLLFAAWNEPDAPLFEEVSRNGRLQQLEGAAILLYLKMGNEFEAARLAMRMFAEDEYILESSFSCAGRALLQLMRDNDAVTFTKKTVSFTRNDLRRMLKLCKNVNLDVGKCLVFTVELSGRWEGDAILDRINEQCLQLYDRHCAPVDSMGLVAYSSKESLTVELGTKDGNEGRQRTLLDIATSTTTERANPAFPLAFQMVVDSQASLDSDSYIVLLLDGYAWDSDSCASIQLQLERLNRERSTLIHLFIVGLDIEDEDARQQCIGLCNVTKASLYADATIDNIDRVFESITAAIAGRMLSTGFLKGITMERF